MHKSSIKTNFFYQMLYQVLIIILPLITSPYIARVIGAEGLGKYSYSYSIAYYFVLFSMLGLVNYGNRAIAQCRDNQSELNETFSNIAALHILFSTICCVVYVLYVVFIAKAKLYAWIQFAYVLSGLFDITWFYFGIEKFKSTVIRNSIVRIANVICVFVFVRKSTDLWKYCVIMAFGMLISQLVLWIPLKKHVRFCKPSWEKMVPHIKPLLVLFVPAIAVSLYKYMDKIMLGTWSSKAQLGLFDNAEKMVSIPVAVIASFGTVMLPKMSNLAKFKVKDEAHRYISLSMKYVMCLAFALTFGLAGIGTVFAPVFWGKEFVLSGTIIMGLSITVPFLSFANVIRTQYLIPTKKDNEYLCSVVGGAITNLAINMILIPKIGARGATLGTIFAEIVVCSIQSWVVRKRLPLRKYLKSVSMFFAFGVIMFIAVYSMGMFMPKTIVTLLAQIAVGGIIYIALCIAYFVSTKDTLIMNLINVVRRKKNKDI